MKARKQRPSRSANRTSQVIKRLDSIEQRLLAIEQSSASQWKAIRLLADAFQHVASRKPAIPFAAAQALANQEVLRDQLARDQRSMAANSPRAKSRAATRVAEWIADRETQNWIPASKKVALAECTQALSPTVVSTRVFNDVWARMAPGSWKRPGRR